LLFILKKSCKLQSSAGIKVGEKKCSRIKGRERPKCFHKETD